MQTAQETTAETTYAGGVVVVAAAAAAAAVGPQASTPDRSPIVGKTPIQGLYLNCGWGTGGFKATPGAADMLAYTIAHDAPHKINAPFNLDRFVGGRLIDEAAAAAVAH